MLFDNQSLEFIFNYMKEKEKLEMWAKDHIVKFFQSYVTETLNGS